MNDQLAESHMILTIALISHQSYKHSSPMSISPHGNPRHRVEFCQKIVHPFWNRWSRDVLHHVPRKKWNTESRNVRVSDIVIIADPNAVRGKWHKGEVVQVFLPGEDGLIQNVQVKMAKRLEWDYWGECSGDWHTFDDWQEIFEIVTRITQDHMLG